MYHFYHFHCISLCHVLFSSKLFFFSLGRFPNHTNSVVYFRFVSSSLCSYSNQITVDRTFEKILCSLKSFAPTPPKVHFMKIPIFSIRCTLSFPRIRMIWSDSVLLMIAFIQFSNKNSILIKQ